MNIVLIGYRGTGKTTIARELGKKLLRNVLSTDEIIEKRLKKTIPEIVKEKGWGFFRRSEQKVVKELSKADACIIDCGGGVILRKENIKNLKKNGEIFLLTSSPEKIRQRIMGSKKRPALKKGGSTAEEIEEALKERKKAYESSADFVVDSNGAIKDAVDEIMDILKNKNIR